MLQRAKSSDGSRLRVVAPDQAAPSGEAAAQAAVTAETEAKAAQPEAKAAQSETKAAQPEAPGAKHGAKPGLGAVLKANRMRVLMGVGAVAALGLIWAGYGYVTTGR